MSDIYPSAAAADGPAAGLRGRRRAVRGRLLLGALVALVALLFQVFLGAGSAGADSRPPGGVLSDSLVRAVDIAAPASVRVATLYKAHITFALCGAQVTLPASGAGYTTGDLGSGAFISANGDILTADHVVDLDKASLDGEIFQSSRAAPDIAAAINAASCLHLNFAIGPADVAAGIVQQLGIPYSTTYTPPQYFVWQSTSYTGQVASGAGASGSLLVGLLSAPSQQATVLASSSFNDDDIAVLHVALSDTPSIPLAGTPNVAVEDRLTVIGFPGNGDFSSDPTDLLTVSVNNASVSAIKQNDNGSTLIQIGGNVEHGDSGGPALDTEGHLVGIVSFGGTDTPGTTSFLRSSDSARAVIAKANVSMTPGAFQTHWQQAFAAYAATTPGHWHTAAQALDALSQQYPSFKGVLPYKQYADTQEAVEPLPAARGAPFAGVPLSAALAGGAALLSLLALLALGIVLVVTRGRRNAARAAVTVPAGQPYYAPPVGTYAPPPGASWPPPGTTPYPAPPYSAPTYGAPSGPIGQMPAGPWQMPVGPAQLPAQTPPAQQPEATPGRDG